MSSWDQFIKEITISSLFFLVFLFFGVIVVSIENGDLTILVNSRFWLNFISNPLFYVAYIFCYAMVVFKRLSANKSK